MPAFRPRIIAIPMTPAPTSTPESDSAEARLAALGPCLPPVVAPGDSFQPYTRVGSMLYLSGTGSLPRGFAVEIEDIVECS